MEGKFGLKNEIVRLKLKKHMDMFNDCIEHKKPLQLSRIINIRRDNL